MSVFDIYPIREELIRKNFEIDISLYEQLEKLSNEKYDASINKLTNTCIEFLLKNKQINLYKRKNEITVYRGFLIRKSLMDGIVEFKKEYNLPINTIVNIAIYNALCDEGCI